MGRFETLNPETQDVVEAILPAIAKAFKIHDVKDVIPEDIRMRIWDCDKRLHIKDETEDEPRDWGVQFLKDLQAIARLLHGDLDQFHADLRAKVEKHAERHPWCRLADIKALKKMYQNPDAGSDKDPDAEEYVAEYASSPDSYFEELVEQEVPKGKRRRPNHEAYETRQQQSQKKRRRNKSARLRRDSEGWERPRKESRDQAYRSVEDRSSSYGRNPNLPQDARAPSSLSQFESYLQPDVPLESQKLQAELEVAEAELNFARLKLKFFEAKEREQSEVQEEIRYDPHQPYSAEGPPESYME